MKIATDIKTEKWNEILLFFTDTDWFITEQYPDVFNKAIDEDFYVLRKDNEEIEFGWTNWFEGEIKASEERLIEIGEKFEIEFKFGTPECLSN